MLDARGDIQLRATTGNDKARRYCLHSSRHEIWHPADDVTRRLVLRPFGRKSDSTSRFVELSLSRPKWAKSVSLLITLHPMCTFRPSYSLGCVCKPETTFQQMFCEAVFPRSGVSPVFLSIASQ